MSWWVSYSFLAPCGGMQSSWTARMTWRRAIADHQDDLAQDLANQAEVLENTRFVRQIATSKEEDEEAFRQHQSEGCGAWRTRSSVHRLGAACRMRRLHAC